MFSFAQKRVRRQVVAENENVLEDLEITTRYRKASAPQPGPVQQPPPPMNGAGYPLLPGQQQ